MDNADQSTDGTEVLNISAGGYGLYQPDEGRSCISAQQNKMSAVCAF